MTAPQNGRNTIQSAIDAIEAAMTDLNERLAAGTITQTFYDTLHKKYEEVAADLQKILDDVEGDGK